MHTCVLSCEATRLTTSEPIAFYQPPRGPLTHCHSTHKVYFHENHLELVTQALKNRLVLSTGLGVLFPHVIGSAYHYSLCEQSRG